MRMTPKWVIAGVGLLGAVVLVGIWAMRPDGSVGESNTALVEAADTTIATTPTTEPVVTTSASTTTTTVATTTTLPWEALLGRPGHGVAVGGTYCEAIWVEDSWLKRKSFIETGLPMPPQATCIDESGVKPCGYDMYATWEVWSPIVEEIPPSATYLETAKQVLPDADQVHLVGLWRVDLNRDGYREVVGRVSGTDIGTDDYCSDPDGSGYFVRMFQQGEILVFTFRHNGPINGFWDVNRDGFAEIYLESCASWPETYAFSDIEHDFVRLETFGCGGCAEEECDW